MIYNRFNLIETIKKIDDVDLIHDIANSFNKSQELSKTWLSEYLPNSIPTTTKVLVAAGWYGLMAQIVHNKLRCAISTFDMNPKCERWGRLLFDDRDINFFTDRIENVSCAGYDIIICTSCEHFSDEVLNNFLSKKRKHARVYLQSNNFFDEPTHVNCKKSIDDFVSNINLEIVKTDTLTLNYGFDRYLVVGK